MHKVPQTHAVPPCFLKIGDDLCTGCAACANGCRRSAIKIVLNSEGFYRPVLHHKRCNNCGACLTNCPVLPAVDRMRQGNLKDSAPEIYAAWTSDEKVHLSSSSGGIFSELARHVIGQSGVVCGCQWDDKWKPHHVMVRDWAGIDKLRGSKYIPSHIDNQFFKKIIDLARTGTTVLFCGTPCQVAGLARITPIEARPNLLLADLVCHGVPSLISFRCYLDWKFGKTDDLEYLSFRNKEISVKTICAVSKSGKKYLAEAGADPWFRAAMVYHLFLQKSCFHCRFSELPRYGDITLGDFWGIPETWHHPAGDSVVLANTEKGLNIINQLIQARRISVRPSDYATASIKNGRLRGKRYPAPFIRSLSLYLVSRWQSFGLFYRLFYLPRSLQERSASFVRRRIRFVLKQDR